MKIKENKIPFLISYVSGTRSHFDAVVGDYSTNIYTDFLVYATSLSDMYKRMRKEKGITKSKIKVKTLL